MSVSTINWGSVADWVSGLGSVSAAVVALYLSRSAQRIKLSGYCGLRVSLSQGLPPQDLVFIAVTNVGSRSTVVSTLTIKTGIWKKRLAILTMMKDQYSVGLPHPLADGQAGHWGVPLDDQKTWLVDLCRDFIKTPWDVRTARFEIHTTNGGKLTLRPEQPLRKAMLATIGVKDA